MTCKAVVFRICKLLFSEYYSISVATYPLLTCKAVVFRICKAAVLEINSISFCISSSGAAQKHGTGLALRSAAHGRAPPGAAGRGPWGRAPPGRKCAGSFSSRGGGGRQHHGSDPAALGAGRPGRRPRGGAVGWPDRATVAAGRPGLCRAHHESASGALQRPPRRPLGSDAAAL